MDITLSVDCIHVGHGDCTLITANSDAEWSCIIDVGKGDSGSYKSIHKVLQERNIKRIDLAILTHFDSDHIGGFNHLANDVEIVKYWSPYTPAIEKYRWLFGERGEKAVTAAMMIEKRLLELDTILESPTEGYVISPIRGLRVKVLSPPIKLYQHLLMAKYDIHALQDFDSILGSLVTEDYDEVEQISREARSMYNRYVNGTIVRNIAEENTTKSSVANSQTQRGVNAFEPEFFGNRALNNTSLVTKIEFWTGMQWYSLLFPGDLENWIYLLAARPDSLVSNFYKASHHGGKLYYTSMARKMQLMK